MPERNGIDTAIWFRDCEKLKQMKNVPIIGLTGHEVEDVKKNCFDAGMNQVFTKPFKREELIRLLKAYS